MPELADPDAPFPVALSGGHPNSLGNTEHVVGLVLADRTRLDELFDCYFSNDPIVRLRTSSAMKRVTVAQPDWVVPYLDRLLTEISLIDQPSTQWTLALLFTLLEQQLTPTQKAVAIAVLQRNLDSTGDWIVENTTIDTLGRWAADNKNLREWLLPRLAKYVGSPRKSVAARARRMRAALS